MTLGYVFSVLVCIFVTTTQEWYKAWKWLLTLPKGYIANLDLFARQMGT